MTVELNMHHIKSAIAKQSGPTSWLTFTDEKRNTVTLFLPLSVAEALAETFADATDAHENAAEAYALEVQRAGQTIAAAGMGGNGFAGAEYAAHVLTVAMRNGGA
jgi:hypothetical protein